MAAANAQAILKRHSEAESRIAASLIELDGDATYQLLKASSLTGVTRKRLGVSFDRVSDLWSWSSQISATLTRARELLDEGGWGANKREAEAVKILTLPTIDVGTDASPQHVPIQVALDRFREVIDPLQEGLGEVEARWSRLIPRLDAALATLQGCDRDFEALGIRDSHVRQLIALVEATRWDLMTDPLGMSEQIGDDIERQVATQARRASELREGKDSLGADLNVAEALLVELRRVRAEAAAARSETLVKIKDPDGLVTVPAAAAIDGDRGLRARLDDLRASNPTDSWQNRRRSLDGWMDTAQRLLGQLNKARDANRAGLDRRDDLRGLLDSYRAKAKIMGKAGEPSFGDLHDAAHRELYRRPADVDLAAELVANLGATLS